MSTAAAFEPLEPLRGPVIPNRIALAPMTNQQSEEDGTLSTEEIDWLTARARGGFGLVTTACSHVAVSGKGFPGELGIFDDALLPGLERLATSLREAGSVSAVQLYHGGMRALGDERVGPSDDVSSGTRALTTFEVEELLERFVAAAVRAERAGFDGVQIHGAHGYLVSEFLSPVVNRRTDEFGGSPAGRARFLLTLIDRIREECGPGFQLGARISPERFGQDLFETVELAERLIDEEKIDMLDVSLWDVRKRPENERAGGRSLIDWFTRIPRRGVRLGVSGKIIEPADVEWALSQGADYISLGKVAIVNAEYPRLLRSQPDFEPYWRPTTHEHLRSQSVGPRFSRYLSTYTHPVFRSLPASEGAPKFDIDAYLRGEGH
ncbi:NADH:flavin oxidoreductase [Leucobacter weissii]|uniref:NADH:flavin oxidoreductase n=1 Tax=Leucobacter weissii TaxID=1983706 RepID=A0A939SA34_9MICO|nr:NADH:flavin oxidoreductase [Leucobacter weissii]MBO1901542.1 NADH:flavin oxidoreductase [Leucobacter weissii]